MLCDEQNFVKRQINRLNARETLPVFLKKKFEFIAKDYKQLCKIMKHMNH